MKPIQFSFIALFLCLSTSMILYFSVENQDPYDHEFVGLKGSSYRGLVTGDFEGVYFISCDGEKFFEVLYAPYIRGFETKGRYIQPFRAYANVKGIAAGASKTYDGIWPRGDDLPDSDIIITEVVSYFDGEKEGCFDFKRFLNHRYNKQSQQRPSGWTR